MITSEDFKKLKQNDRIEFMLKHNHLNENKDSLYFNWSSIICLLFALIGFIILLSMQLYIIGGYDSFISIFNLIAPLTQIMVIVVFFGVLWNLLWYIKFSKYRKELEEEFFKTETKPRK